MSRRMTVAKYLLGPESLQPSELVFGVVREPPAPRYGHQSVVTRAAVILDQHVRDRGLGRVCVSPVDVVLDRERALIVQPDVLFVSAARLGMVRDQVWGAPDLVVEVLSPGTATRDRSEKLAWYRQYGVRECWLVDPVSCSIEIIDCEGHRRTVLAQDDAIRSRVLPELSVCAGELFD